MQHTACILLAGFVSVTIQFTHLITFAAAIEHIIFVFTCAIKLSWNSIYYYSYECCFHLWTVWAILAFNFFSGFFWIKFELKLAVNKIFFSREETYNDYRNCKHRRKLRLFRISSSLFGSKYITMRFIPAAYMSYILRAINSGHKVFLDYKFVA